MWLRNIWSTKLLKSNPESNNSANFLEFTLFYRIHQNCENMFFLVFWKIPQNMNNILWTCQYQRWLATRVGVDEKNSEHDEAICSVLFSVKNIKSQTLRLFFDVYFSTIFCKVAKNLPPVFTWWREVSTNFECRDFYSDRHLYLRNLLPFAIQSTRNQLRLTTVTRHFLNKFLMSF